MSVLTNGAATNLHEEALVRPIARGGNFVRTGQEFIGALGSRRAWNYYLAVVALVVLFLFAIFVGSGIRRTQFQRVKVNPPDPFLCGPPCLPLLLSSGGGSFRP